MPLLMALLLALASAGGAAAQSSPMKGRSGPLRSASASVALDGAALGQSAPAPPDAKPDPISSSSASGDVLMTESFEGAFPQGDWEVFANGGFTRAYWDDVNFRARNGEWSAWCADEGPDEDNPPGPYPDDMNAWMVYGPFDLSAATSPALEYALWNESEEDFDFFYALASVDGANFNGFSYSGSTGGWADQALDLTAVPTLGDLRGEPQVWIAFLFTSDGSVAMEGAYVDDVVLRAGAAAPPDISVNPADLSFDLPPDGSGTQTLTIRNDGEGALEWELATNVNGFGREAHDPALLGAAYAHGAAAGGQARQAVGFAAMLAEARGGGRVPILVELAAPFQPEEVLGRVRSEAQRQGIAARQDGVLRALDGTGLDAVKRFASVPYLALHADAVALERLGAHPDVVRVVRDVPAPHALRESVALIGGEAAWAAGYSGAGQAVAVLDTGVDSGHPFLAGKVVSEACYSTNGDLSESVCPGGVEASTAPGSGEDCPPSAGDGCTHGTHVAGIVAGRGDAFSGVARDASVIAVQVFSKFDSADQCGAGNVPCVLTWTSDQLLGLGRVYELRTTHAIAAVNMSLGGGEYTAYCEDNPLKPIIDNLRAAGIATVIATGNSGFSHAVGGPACISTAVSVGSTGDGSGGVTTDVVSSFSNSAPMVDLLAPGQWINSSVPGGGFDSYQGTSMATPHVAGAWAVLKQAEPEASVSAIEDALASTGVPVTDGRNGLTRPRIQVDAALEAASSWLRVALRTGVVAPGAEAAITITADAAGLEPGTHTGQLTLVSNDPDEATVVVPVALRVGGVANEPGAGGAGQTALHASQPNPVAGRATLRYDVAQAGRVRLSVLDLLGREVAVLADEAQAAGRHEAMLDGTALTPGVYVVRLHADDGVQAQRVTVVR